ncbi:hypothetical protein C5G87_03885 [Paenibacillus peoriae]|uniref:Uncharacterized protein n=1 Tax=Paenibacillus polymyxa TaxID=1406 RepID=A0AAP3ZYS4_PAEPO|nr:MULTISPECIES: hypothetical protein [Paenibacillus]AHC19704.2 hypothetical protein X809_10820 [Paenibacillus polymyxa CR1]APB76309.1 hypothetical protein PPYC2_15690 [Paenibacillus polymyxa]MDH2329414.1 hypothetical protein [Paenibacillus polymyxa]MXO80567.1 hypothetical protein [Paenibacillus sp. OT2-17]OMF35334.1 hypothetical protein BK134_03340 [Paenibacillus peoriae]
MIVSTTQPRFAFLSKDGILRLHDEEHAAQHGNHVLTSLTDDESGYPVVEGQGDVYYAYEDKAYIKGNKGDGQLIPTPPVLKQIAAELL